MIEISMEAAAPAGLDVEGAVGRAGQFALEQEGQGDAWLSVQVVDDEAIRILNRDFRGLDRPTDVLSFPMEEGDPIAAIPDGFLGDIVISLDKALAQAAEYGHSPLRELSFLTVHGVLHLLGWDHMEPGEAARMYRRQEEILEKMGVLR